MMKKPGVGPAAIGILIRCGKATAVLVAGSVEEPQVIDRRIISLADPTVPDSIQPYHVFETRSGRTAEQLVAKLEKRVIEISGRSITKLLSEYQNLGHNPRHALLVVGSLTDPATIKNPHIQWHALEGQLFRTAVEKSLTSKGLTSTVLLSKEIYKKGTEAFNKKEEELKKSVKEMGRSMGSWRSEDKAASLAAWIGLLTKTKKVQILAP
jgi:hypothetical protein